MDGFELIVVVAAARTRIESCSTRHLTSPHVT